LDHSYDTRDDFLTISRRFDTFSGAGNQSYTHPTNMQLSNTMLLAAAATLSIAHEVDTRSFEGPVLERRSNWAIGDCYSSSGNLHHNGTDTYQSQGACEGVAGSNNVVIALTNGNDCYYGNELPPESDKVDSSKCSVACVGYPGDNCGAEGFFRIYTNGVVTATSGDDDSGSGSSNAADSSTPATTAPPSNSPATILVSQAGTTVVVTQANGATAAAATVSIPASTNTSSGNNNGGGSSHAGAIAAGVVVGVVGVAAIIGAIFFWRRSRKHREEAAELQRQNSIAGLRSEKPPSTYSLTDSRLEPAYMRRMSDGSIADNQDYSRRILKVTNPDDR